VALPVAVLGGQGPELVANGNFSKAGSPPIALLRWHSYTWQGTFETTRSTASFGSGGWSALLHGYGTGKYALIQTLALTEPGRYTLQAVVAVCDATQQGLYKDIGRFTLYAAFADPTGAAVRTAIGDLQLLPSIEQDVNTDGKVGWRRLTANFSLPAAANMTLYFRVWASGWFLVDDVSVRLNRCAPYDNLTDAITIGNRTLEPLNFTPPMVFEDLLLCGYCTAASVNASAAPLPYNQLEHCVRCRAANRSALVPHQSDGAHPLTTFGIDEPGLFSPDKTCWRYTNRSLHDARRDSSGSPPPPRSVLLYAGKYMVSQGALLRQVLNGDWSTWSYLRVQYRHSSPNPQQLYIEVDDAHSSNYWDRLNWYTYLPPGQGWREAMLPLHQAVGEKSEIGVMRRRLDLSQVVKLGLSAMGDVDIEFASLVLIPTLPYQHDFSTLLKLDVQPRDAPVWWGFTGVYADPYISRRGYGSSVGTKIWQTEDRQHPTALLGDWVSFESGGLQMLLPAGEYGVWLCMEDAGYWEYYQNYLTRAVTLQGRVAMNQTETLEQFWLRYYAHEHTEDLPGDDTFGRYITPR
jgi:hypothetical protein